MSCNQSDKTNTTYSPLPTPVNLAGNGSGTKRFLVIDNPEKIVSSTFTNSVITLYHDSSTVSNRVSYRVFLWTLNNSGSTIKVGVTVGNGSSDTYSIQNVRWQLPAQSTNYPSVGKCLAKALVGNTLDNTTPVDSSISPGKVGLVKEYTISNNYLVGCILEFDIVGSGSLIYKVRGVVANNTSADLRLNQSAPVPVDEAGSHPRGGWPFADVLSSDINYIMGSGDKMYNTCNSSAPSSGDYVFRSDNSYTDGSIAVGNPGQFGAIHTVNVKLMNQGSVTRQAKIYLSGRGGPFYGAVKVNGTTYGIDNIHDTTITQVADVTVNPNITTTVPIVFSTGGGSYTPLGVFIRTI